MPVTVITTSDQIVGAKVGESVLVHLITGKIEKVIFNGSVRNGIEGFNLELNTKPLTFYPYSSIIKITKYSEIT